MIRTRVDTEMKNLGAKGWTLLIRLVDNFLNAEGTEVFRREPPSKH